MDSIFEDQRLLHEERDRVIDTMVREFVAEKRTHKARINSDHRIKNHMERYLGATKKLRDIYTQNNSQRETESRSLGGPNEFAEFYSRLKTLKEHHKNEAEINAKPMSNEFHIMNQTIEDADRRETDMVAFTDEEGYGKFMDLNPIYQKYINLKNVRKLSYVLWLTEFDRLFVIPKETKKTAAYRDYVASLVNYIYEFIEKTRPLMNVEKEKQKCLKKFMNDWLNGRFQGWSDIEKKSSQLKNQLTGHLDLSPYNAPTELQSLGMERLKTALQALGLKCGGTIQERAQRLFSTKGKKLEDLDPSLFAKGASSIRKEGIDDKEKQRAVAVLEAQIYHFIEMLSEERVSTRENVERKQARTVGELEEADDEEEAAIEEAAKAAAVEIEEADLDIPYNPKNLPLGFDGKPIPYWLYKLHGLNIVYSCEICGNMQYKGPKAFQLHFQEWRHSHGMRCLGIPNTAHFNNITKIQEAIELWKTISARKEHERFKPEMEEEFEDSAGNVVTRKTFEDLKRQGLL